MTNLERAIRQWSHERLLRALVNEDDPALRDELHLEFARRQSPEPKRELLLSRWSNVA